MPVISDVPLFRALSFEQRQRFDELIESFLKSNSRYAKQIVELSYRIMLNRDLSDAKAALAELRRIKDVYEGKQ